MPAKRIGKSDEKEAQAKHLDMLALELKRNATIQDVGLWLIDCPLEPLTPRLVRALSGWLKEHNSLTIKQNRRGSPHSDIRDVFPIITRIHRDTGMSIEAACLMIVGRLNLEIDPANLRRAYDRARTPHGKLLDALIGAADDLGGSGSPTSDVRDAALAFKQSRDTSRSAPKNREIRTQKLE